MALVCENLRNFIHGTLNHFFFGNKEVYFINGQYVNVLYNKTSWRKCSYCNTLTLKRV